MANPSSQYLSIRAVAEELDMCARTIRRWIEAGDLPALKVGRHWRVARRDLDAFLLRCRKRGALVSPNFH